jgi:CubicO group peptidase (beta-lactamase class C family)
MEAIDGQGGDKMSDTVLNSQNTVAWHGRDSAQHKALVDKWAALDFRTTSLSIYSYNWIDTGVPLYAAVMVKRPAVHAESQVFPRTQAALQQDFDNFAKIGRGPYILAVTGPPNAPVFAASFRPMSPIPFTRLNLSQSDFATLNAQRHKLGEILIWVDVFGDPANPRFAAIWGADPSKQGWSVDGWNPASNGQDFVLPPTLLQQRFDAVTSTWGRPAHISMTPVGAGVELFVDSTIGRWASSAGMTADQYQVEFDQRTKEGLEPVRVSAKGVGSEVRFAAIFASREETDPRTFRSQGPVSVAAIDQIMQDYMETENLRGAGLAIARGTQLVYAKGYTLAEASYPDITPQTLFRQASVSKTFTGLAMMRILQENPNIALNTTVQSIMNLKQPNGAAPADSRRKDITLQHLLESDSGIPQGLLYKSAAAAQKFGKPLPSTFAQLLSYAASLQLTGAPGDPKNSVYGNFDYLLLGQIIGKIHGAASFEQALAQLVLEPLHQTHTRGSRSLITDQLPGEARHHMIVYDPGNGWPLYPFEVLPTVRAPGGKLVPTHYGALDYEMFSSAGGLSSSVVDMARLAAMFSDRVANPVLNADRIDNMLNLSAKATQTLKTPDGKGGFKNSHGYYGLDWVSVGDAANHVFTGSKGGWLPGQGTTLHFTTGGFAYALAVNCDSTVSFDWFTPVANFAQSYNWGSGDLFVTSFGMPPLGPVMAPLAVAPAVGLSATETEAQVKASMSRAWAEREKL